MKRVALLLALVVAVPLFADPQKTSLLSNSNSTASTAAGSPVTTQLDNLRLEATVKWLGPSSKGSLIVYNGNGCCSGWGILVLSNTDSPANALSVLAGGVTVVPTSITLTPNKWQHVTMDRVSQTVTLTVTTVPDDDDDVAPPPQTASLGFIPANFIGLLRPAQTYVGDAFNGFVNDAKITDLGSGSVIDSWDFTHAQATFGKLNLYGGPVGANGHVLSNFTSSWAVPAHGNN